MLSYRHSFHAGNHADVLKHTVQSLIIESLKEKEKPFLYLDTHAGAGRYQLSGEHAERTGEYLEGIARIWQQDDLPAELEPIFPWSSTSTVAASCATTRALR
jgi:23S rRNA (adenine2030-N6)-methyltransferase